MEIELEDGPSFVKQRRNVMLICLVVAAAAFLNLDLSNATFFSISVGKVASARLPLAFAFFTWYFVWRLSQCDIPGNLLQWPQGFAYQYLIDRLPRHSDYAAAEQAVIDEYNKHLKDFGTKDIQLSPTPLSVKTRSVEEMKIKSIEHGQAMQIVVNPGLPVTYKLQFTLNLNHENGQTTRSKDMVLLRKDWLYKWAWYRGYALASFRKLYFTEYLLPYLMGFICIGYCIYIYSTAF